MSARYLLMRLISGLLFLWVRQLGCQPLLVVDLFLGFRLCELFNLSQRNQEVEVKV